MQQMTKRKAQPVVAPRMSQETKELDDQAQTERQPARPMSNRMMRVRRVVNRYLDNSRRYHAGDPEALPPGEFPTKFN